jgi:molybdopterin-guanine dinucleotide biosynthesis adapter protein
MKVFSVSGYSKKGKTTTVTKIVTALKQKGYRVAAIKDIHFEEFSMERKGSDSWNMQQAGANPVVARGLKETFFVHPQQMPLVNILELLKADWVVVEGMKTAPLPKIVCAESEEELAELVDGRTFAVSGKISDKIKDYKGLPVINSLDNSQELLALVEKKVFEVLPLNKEECCQACGLSCQDMVVEILAGRKKREDCVVSSRSKMNLKIADEEILMVPFVENVLVDMITAFAKNLRGYQDGNIEITIQ